MKKIKYLLMTVIMQSAVILINSCAVNPVTGRNQFMLVSEKQELEMGRQYDPQVISTFGEYQNAALQTFIMEKGAEMGKISHRPKLEYHFRILDSPVINAFAVPCTINPTNGLFPEDLIVQEKKNEYPRVSIINPKKFI